MSRHISVSPGYRSVRASVVLGVVLARVCRCLASPVFQRGCEFVADRRGAVAAPSGSFAPRGPSLRPRSGTNQMGPLSVIWFHWIHGSSHLQQMAHIRAESRDTLLENDGFPPRVLDPVANMFRSCSQDQSGSRKQWNRRTHVVPMCSWRVEACLIHIYLFSNGVLTSTHGHQ